MRELVAEILLRLLRVILATFLGVVVWLLATGPGGAQGSVELWLLCWMSGVGFIVMVDKSPL